MRHRALALALVGLLAAVPQAAAQRRGCGKVGGWNVYARHISCAEARAVVASWQDTDLTICIPFGCRVSGYSCQWHRSHLNCHKGRSMTLARP
jgi:hypothetical protein